jgi:O-acetyl-ADP-ribose deacetylase
MNAMEVKVGGTTLELVEADITEMDVDAIVNPANSRLILGGGVAGAIAMKGGPRIQEDCSRIGGTPVGTAVITTAGNLKARHIIHAVGPRMGEGDEEAKLAGATRSALQLARDKHLRSIAFPAISTGIFGFDMARCAGIMLEVITDYLRGPTQIERVVVCLWGEEAFNVFASELEGRTRT